MHALLLLLTLAVDARAGVAVSAEAGADAAVPRISLQTSLSPMTGPALGATSAPGLNGALAAPQAPAVSALAAPSALTPGALPAPLAASAIASPALATPAAVKAAAARSDDGPARGDAAVRPVLSAAAAPDAPADPEKAAAPADKNAPSFKTKILGMLKSMANPFGGKKAEEAPPASEAERLDREFAKLDLWGQVAPGARAEIEDARAAKMSKAAFKEYVSKEADAAIERIKKARGVSNIGFHFNLHGGRRQDYVGAGIRATMGDIAARYDMNADRNQKVYFFQSAEHGGYVPLDASNGEILFLPSRMGYALNLFDLDAPELAAARADGRIRNFGAISMDFHGMRGVPYSAYLAPPVEVFIGTAKKIGLKKLTRDEETLATVRYLEAAALAGGAYVPR
ncbi:MAG: hypothetical protein HYV14_15115 [Elusimicrobia bacterium]|nr:hypothetical protein [Elusimicrobiota bacterium]